MSRLGTGGLIDRSQPLSFSFDGKAYSGFKGDSLAAALIANDVKLVGRSFKYHRPRGIWCAGSEEPNALITLRTGAAAEPNTRATTTELFDNLTAASQNRWPSLAFDLMAVNQLASPLFVAGFYYKTFMWPARFWEKLYEPLIRRAAGLGALSGRPDPDSYDRAHAFCDLLVIGAGPAGLAAARTAGRGGLRVILVDEDWMAGGRLLSERHEINGEPGVDWVASVVAELVSLSNVTVMSRTSLFGVYDGCEYAAIERVSDHLARPAPGQPRQRLWKIIAKRAVLASGAIERPIVFGGNDRPGVMSAAAVQTYVNRYAVAPGKNIVVFTTSDSGWSVAENLVSAGITVSAVVDARPTPDLAAVARLRDLGIDILTQAVLTDTFGVPISAIEVRMSDGTLRRLRTDLLCVAGGWNPVIGPGCHLGGRPVWSDAINSFVLDQTSPGMLAIGAAAGHFAVSDALKDGVASARGVLVDLGFTPPGADPVITSEDPVAAMPLWYVGDHKTKAFVDFQHDVTDADIALSAREGFISIEHMKRYTTLGMATDQGKTSQLNAHALLAAATGKSLAETGTILSRPPFVPVAIGAFAGHHRDEYFRPRRLTPSHDWAVEQGATFVDTGLWKRAQWYARPGEKDWLETVCREVTATRNGVGICDVSTLGKIDVHGPDAGRFLDRLYANMISTLGSGKVRYGLMLREDGIVMDDGTVTRFADDHFYVTTTTVNAAKVMQHIDYARQVLWPDMDVQATSVTEQWASYAVAGPRSRDLLMQLLPHLDLSNDALPFMAATAFNWRGVSARLFRVSFSGELAYEIGVPANHGDALVRALFEAGQDYGVAPYGTEALGVMRVEKGHPAGNELNGQTTAADLGMGRMLSTKKDFIGRILAKRPGLDDPSRPALVGLKPHDRTQRLYGGGHLLPLGADANAINDQGFVTSAAFSPGLGHWIGLGLLKDGAARHGERVCVHDPMRGLIFEVEVCSPVFVDPEGVKVRG